MTDLTAAIAACFKAPHQRAMPRPEGMFDDDGEPLARAFDPNQPRDERGRWTDTGASDGSGKIKDKKGRTYDVKHKLGVNNEHHYEVYLGDKWIGEARLSHTGEYVVDLHIDPEFRRSGIASALYDHIEQHLGHPLVPSPVHQTEEGAAFWSGRDKPGIKAIGSNKKHKTVKARWIAGSPIKTIDDLVENAPPAQREMGAAGRAIAKKHGVQFKDPGVKTKSEKGIARTAVKAKERGAAGVTDVVRSTFVIDRPSQVEEIVADLGERFAVTVEDWKVTKQGYMDRSALVRFKNGMIGEIQFMDDGMSHAKSDTGGNGHGMYVEWRALNPRSSRARALSAQMRALYGAVTDAYTSDWKAVLGKAGT